MIEKASNHPTQCKRLHIASCKKVQIASSERDARLSLDQFNLLRMGMSRAIFWAWPKRPLDFRMVWRMGKKWYVDLTWGALLVGVAACIIEYIVVTGRMHMYLPAYTAVDRREIHASNIYQTFVSLSLRQIAVRRLNNSLLLFALPWAGFSKSPFQGPSYQHH